MIVTMTYLNNIVGKRGGNITVRTSVKVKYFWSKTLFTNFVLKAVLIIYLLLVSKYKMMWACVWK